MLLASDRSGNFTATVPGVTSFAYSFDWGPETTIATTDGTASVSWAPDTSGSHLLYVYGIGADGTIYDTYYYSFDVND